MWMEIITALILGAFVIYMIPRAKHMVENSPKAKEGDWMSVLLPLVAVVGFIILLINMV